MADPRTFHFPLGLLLQEGGLILNAAEKYAAQINPRLPDGHVAAARALAEQLLAANAQQKSDAGQRGVLTREQNAKLKELNALLSDARRSARRAFRGQAVKLRQEFQVGEHAPTTLGSVLERARIVAASLRKSENAAALRAQGWTAQDTAALEAAIEGLSATDAAQEAAKASDATAARNRLANRFYEAVLAVQNAAELHWPEGRAGHAAIRAEFRLGVFPPRTSSKAKGKAPSPSETAPSA